MEHQVLYRKYRPQTFAEIVGQEHVVKALQNSLAQDKIAHAYLLAGPRGSGKTTIARILAKSLNCASRLESSDPCNKCSQCLDFNASRSLDLIEIDAASNRGIDEIRSLRENVRFGPSSGRYKVYLIDEAHMITPQAFNAFLKTLEEPPAHVVFILATTEAHRLLPTIISRTQRFDFKRLSVSELVDRLSQIAQKEKVEVEPGALKLIAHEADGAARDAEGLLEQVIATGENKITLEQAEEILGLFSHRKIKDFVSLVAAQNQAGALAWLHKIVNAGYDINQLLKSLNHYVRKMIMISVSPELSRAVKSDLAEDDYRLMEAQVGKVSAPELAGWLNVFSQAKKNSANYPLPQMALEVALINLFVNKKQATNDTAGLTIEIPNHKLQITNKSEILNSKQTPMSNVATQVLNPRPPAVDPSGSNSKDILELVVAKWQGIITEVKPHNHSLSGFLMGMKPKDANANSLTLTTKYSFHRDRLNDIKNKKIIEDAVEKVCGRKLLLNCILEK